MLDTIGMKSNAELMRYAIENRLLESWRIERFPFRCRAGLQAGRDPAHLKVRTTPGRKKL